jgi:hypothetical protein
VLRGIVVFHGLYGSAITAAVGGNTHNGQGAKVLICPPRGQAVCTEINGPTICLCCATYLWHNMIADMTRPAAGNALLTPISPPPGAPQHLQHIIATTNDTLSVWQQRSSSSSSSSRASWLDLPWLVIECYMYVRLAAALAAQVSSGGRVFAGLVEGLAASAPLGAP